MLAPVLALNGIAFVQARAMTHFSEGGTRTRKPEELGLGGKLSALFLGVNVPRPVDTATPGSAGLSYETLGCTSADGTRLDLWRVPCDRAKGTVFLFHGYAASKSALVPGAKAFHELGYEALLVDFRGSGGSSGNVTTLGVREADDVAAAVGTFAKEPPILFGVSMGSAAVLRAVSVLGVRPRGIIVECPFGRMLDTVEARFRLMGVPTFPAARLLVFWGGVQLGFDGFAHEPVEYARNVLCPALLMQGESDPTISLDQAREIFANLGGPKRFVTFPGLSHESYLAKRPDEWKSAVTSFLDGLGK